MKSKFLSVFVSVLFVASLFLDCQVHARSSSSSGKSSSSSSSSSRSSSGGYGNSASKSSSSPSSLSPSSGSGYGNSASRQGTESSPARSFSGSGGYGNTAARQAPSGSPSDGSGAKGGYGNSAVQTSGGFSAAQKTSSRSPLLEKMDRKFSKQENAKAYESYTTQQSRFQKGSGTTGYRPGGREQATINSIRTHTASSSSGDYYSRRGIFYDTYHWQPPVYSYRSYNSFGIWDAMMLWFMLDHLSDRQYAEMYYHHRDDPGMQQFRRELDRLSSENAELKEKVRKLDESASSLEQEGVRVDPAYVPPDAAGIALAADYAGAQAPKNESSGFPWGWVAIIGVVGIAVFLLMRRKR